MMVLGAIFVWKGGAVWRGMAATWWGTCKGI